MLPGLGKACLWHGQWSLAVVLLCTFEKRLEHGALCLSAGPGRCPHLVAPREPLVLEKPRPGEGTGRLWATPAGLTSVALPLAFPMGVWKRRPLLRPSTASVGPWVRSGWL